MPKVASLWQDFNTLCIKMKEIHFNDHKLKHAANPPGRRNQHCV